MSATKKNPPFSPSPTTTQENDRLKAIKKLTGSKFSQIVGRISSVEQQIQSRNIEFVSLISKKS